MIERAVSAIVSILLGLLTLLIIGVLVTFPTLSIPISGLVTVFLLVLLLFIVGLAGAKSRGWLVNPYW